MNRFSPHSTINFHKIWLILSSGFMLLFIICILKGIYTVDGSTVDEQTKSLETAIRRSVVQCYVVEGTYPPDLDYLKEHYGITYDSNRYYVDYTAIGSNLMPDITIIPLNNY